jgi:predicted nucleic acid-binding protein
MQPILLDTSVYISALRQGDSAALALRRMADGGPLWLSAVVLEELYAGAGERERRVVERLERDLDGAKRIIVPNLTDWAQAGKVIARVTAKYQFEQIGRARLTNDALIAMSAGRLGVTIVTTNARDFGRLAEFRVFRWQLAVL